MAWEDMPNNLASGSLIKLWVLPPSTKITTGCAKWPEREWKLIWVGVGFGSSGGSGG